MSCHVLDTSEWSIAALHFHTSSSHDHEQGHGRGTATVTGKATHVLPVPVLFTRIFKLTYYPEVWPCGNKTLTGAFL
jgi:hypothetical protein